MARPDGPRTEAIMAEVRILGRGDSQPPLHHFSALLQLC